MHQQHLFSEDDLQFAGTPETKIARDSDPDTSHAAADEVRPKCSLLEARMVSVWWHNGPLTANEAALIAENIPYPTHNDTTATTYRKRYDALIKKDCIEADGKKKCSVTGKLVTVYRIKDYTK